MDEYQQQMKEASRLADEGNTEEAVQAYNSVIEKYHQRVGGYYHLALLYHSLGRLDEAIENFQKAAELSPVDASIFNNLGVLYYLKESLEAAETNFKRAVEIKSDYVDALYGLGKVYQYAGKYGPQKLEQYMKGLKKQTQTLYEQGRMEPAWKISQNMIKLSPDNAEYHNDYAVLCYELGKIEEAREAIDKAQKLAPEDADIQENHQVINSERGKAGRRGSGEAGYHPSLVTTNIFIVCMPKSGSTYLRVLLSEITGFPRVSAVQFYGHNEQDIFELALRQFDGASSITQQHVKGTENNVMLMKKYGIKPVVLVRNIFDILLSLHDHIEREDHRAPEGYVHKEYFSMSKEEKLLYLIRIHLPWFFNFYVSWREASKEIDTLWTSYEELFSDQMGTVSQILSFYGLSVDRDKIQSAMSAMENRDTRRDEGTSGRGASLSETHKKAVLELASVWKLGEKEMEIIGVSL